MEDLFQKMVKAAIALLRKQIQGTIEAGMPAIKTVILCGGMANSAYVQRKIEEHLDKKFSGNVEVVVPAKCWPAIAIGACARGLDLETKSVLFRRSKHWIGVCAHEKYNRAVHEAEDFFEHPKYGVRARNQMRWHVKRVITPSKNSLNMLMTLIGRPDPTKHGKEIRLSCSSRQDRAQGSRQNLSRHPALRSYRSSFPH